MNEFLIIIASAFTTYILKNPALVEGVTAWILKYINKQPIKIIDLKEHTVFIHIRNYKNAINLSLFNNETKSFFYQSFVQILLTNIKETCLKITAEYKTIKNIDNYTMSEIDAMIDKINMDVTNHFNIPPPVQKQFDTWKDKLLSALRRSIEQVVYDNSVESKYLQCYRLLDQVNSFSNYLISTGSITFNQMNGAFDKLQKEDILKVK